MQFRSPLSEWKMQWQNQNRTLPQNPGHTGTKRRKSERGEEESKVPEDSLSPLLLHCTPTPFTQ
jgi:hypothetical protein